MKKTLLLLGALLITMVSYAQTDQQKINNPIISAPWTRISGSYNIQGSLYSQSKPLSFNRYLNAICFIQRKSVTYVTSPSLPPNAESGAIVAMIGKTGGTQWDSTLVYSDTTNWGRFPQGGFYSPMGNSNINNAYAVATGATNDASNGYIGSFYASKSLTNTIQKNAGGPDQQFMPHIAPFTSTTSPNMVKHYFPRYGFSSTDPGTVYSLGGLYDEYGTAQPGIPEKFRGALLARGSFNAGVFVWTADSFIPPAIVKSNGERQISEICNMAWTDDGTRGYIMLIGARNGSTGSNKGWQPLVYKTTNSGNTWALVNGIDFNAPTVWDFVLNSMDPVNTNSTLNVPQFNVNEGIDITIDKNGKLHIFASVMGTSSSHNDSLGSAHDYTINGNPGCNWRFTTNKWPYLVDFIGDGTNSWTYKIIDSVGTQSLPMGYPSTGFPWTQTSAVNGSAYRLQMSRSCNAEYIIYTYAESDSTLTTGNTKWNEFPNIKMKALRMCDLAVSSDKFAVSSPATGFHPRVRDKAYFHYTSPQLKDVYSTFNFAQFIVPMIVSNNVATDPGLPVDHYFCNATIQFSFATGACGSGIGSCPITTINEFKKSWLGYDLYPNPTITEFNISITLDQSEDIRLELFEVVGKLVKQIDLEGTVGQNKTNIDVSNLEPGIYFVKVKAGNAESTKKLIIE